MYVIVVPRVARERPGRAMMVISQAISRCSCGVSARVGTKKFPAVKDYFDLEEVFAATCSQQEGVAIEIIVETEQEAVKIAEAVVRISYL